MGFTHTVWAAPAAPGGYVPLQSGVQPHMEPPGAVTLSGVVGVSVSGCAFLHHGTPYALAVGKASRHTTVDRTLFRDLSGGGPRFGNVLGSRSRSPRPQDWDMDLVLSQSVVEDAAVEYRGMAAVFVGYVRRMAVVQNLVNRSGYTGYSIGWGWGAPSFMAETNVSRNMGLAVMQALQDGGCVYTLGPQPNSTVFGNVCVGDASSVIGVYYHDNGSSGFLTDRNVAASSPAPCVYIQNIQPPATDIVVSNLWYRDTLGVLNRAGRACHCTITNITHVPSGAAWPGAARIIAAAGPGHSVLDELVGVWGGA